jgi:hypothetical protein
MHNLSASVHQDAPFALRHLARGSLVLVCRVKAWVRGGCKPVFTQCERTCAGVATYPSGPQLYSAPSSATIRRLLCCGANDPKPSHPAVPVTEATETKMAKKIFVIYYSM